MPKWPAVANVCSLNYEKPIYVYKSPFDMFAGADIRFDEAPLLDIARDSIKARSQALFVSFLSSGLIDK